MKLQNQEQHITGNDTVSKTDCPWLVDHKAPVNLLNTWDDPRTAIFHSWFEYRIADLIKGAFASDVKMVSVGYFPEWDVGYKDGTLIEIKYTANSGRYFFVETHRDISDPGSKSPVLKESGLSLTKAHYYIVLQRSFLGKHEDGTLKDVVKVKICPVYKLKNAKKSALIKPLSENTNYKSYGFEYPFNEFGDGSDNWVGSFNFDATNNTIDLSDFISFKHGTKRPSYLANHDIVKQIPV